MKKIKNWLEEYIKSESEKLNSEYPGIVSNEMVDAYINKMSNSNYSKDEVIAIIEQIKNQKIKEYLDKINTKSSVDSERIYNLNELFNCRISNNTLHFHIVPVSIKKEISEMGIHNYLKYAEYKLLDAFSKANSILLSKENSYVKTVFAVSPLLRIKAAQDLFRKYGFDVKMSDNEKFKNMFKTDKIGQAEISKEKFMSLESERKKLLDNINQDGVARSK